MSMMTKADYDELVRLYKKTSAIVAYRNPNTHKCFSIALSGAASITDAELSLLEDGDAIHIPSAIAEYEREQEQEWK